MITTLPGGNTVRSDYSGATVTATDQVNRKIKRESDGLGRLIKVLEQVVTTGALTQETSYAYNLLDDLEQVNQGGQYRSYKHDSMGRLLYEKIPEQTPTINDGTGTLWTTAYAYTEFSSVKKKTDARGVETHYAFDALHRVTQIWYTGLGGNDSGSVRPALPSGVAATGDRLFGYTDSGALESVNIPNEYTENYTFDDYGRPGSVTRWILGQSSDTRKTYTTSYEYNGGSQLSKMIYPSGQQVSVNHDDKGRMQSLTGNTSGYLTGVTYNIESRMTGATLGNGVVQGYTFDANRSQLVSQTAAKGANQLMNLAYNYDAAAGQSGVTSTAGNTHQLISLSGTINGTTESASYKYDLQKRLVTSNQTSNGSSAQRKFAYDRWGNRTTVWPSLFGGGPIQPIQTVALEQSGGAPTNRITSVTNSGVTVNYSYDAAGNVTNDGAHSYTFDAANRMVSADNGATAQYKYDHQNQRVSKIAGSSWTHYIWEGGSVIGEHDATTAYTASPPYQEKSARLDYVYARGKMIHTRHRTSGTGSWTTRYYVSDVWSTRLVLDASGNVLGRQAHLAFGEEFAESGTQEKHHFTSYESESESATDYAVNRQYSQSVGRFGSADPYQASGYLVNPQSWNRYSYVENDPIHNVDPLGLLMAAPGPEADPCCVLGGCGSGEPAAVPQPQGECHFGIRYSGFPLGNYPDPPSGLRREPNITPNKMSLGPFTALVEGVTANLFFYEVLVNTFGVNSRNGWTFTQTAVLLATYTLQLPGGGTREVQARPETVDPDMADPWNQSWVGNTLKVWFDTPGTAPNRRITVDGQRYLVLAQSTTWRFTFRARHNSGVQCQGRSSFTLTFANIQSGNPLASWSHD